MQRAVPSRLELEECAVVFREFQVSKDYFFEKVVHFSRHDIHHYHDITSPSSK